MVAPASLRTGPLGLQTDAAELEPQAFTRLWQAFMTARIGIAALLLLVHGAIYVIAKTNTTLWGVLLCVVYLTSTLLVRLQLQPRLFGHSRRSQWIYTIAVDVLTYTWLEWLQLASINYTPLFALPVLLASVLGSLRLAIGAAASVTLLLLLSAWRTGVLGQADWTSHFLQAGLTGAACFILALLVHQLSTRLVREERKSRSSAASVRLQRQVNELVIDALGDGVLVVDANGMVRVANPAALRLLGPGDRAPAPPFDLWQQPGWARLRDLAFQTFRLKNDQRQEISVQHGQESQRRLLVRTRLTLPQQYISENLCVMFLQDLREMEARLRTEKLAAMGRMSTAVAHEIRNPLAAIAQANELLAEELAEPTHKRLSQLVRKNTQRLAKIVDEVLDIARVRGETRNDLRSSVALDDAVLAMSADWCQHSGVDRKRLVLLPQAPGLRVYFDADHLRRVLVNLLDNASRYGSAAAQPIWVQTEVSPAGRGVLRVWSSGSPLEKAVQQHLFEPFFSSESRSSGLGLYICRELCERHRAQISYQRSERERDGSSWEGNEFCVVFNPLPVLEHQDIDVSFRPSTY